MAAGEAAPTVRIRGIYATALTRLVTQEDGMEVVDPSPPIADRFAADFPPGDPTVWIGMTDDRLGVRLTGEQEVTNDVADRLHSVAIDTFSWADKAPEGAVFEGTVDRKDGRGWIVSIGETAGYLPSRRIDAEVAAGQSIRVQVREPTPPWNDSLPRLGTSIQAPGGIASLRRGVDAAVAETPGGEAGKELARTTELLSASMPADWGIAWHPAAIDADMSTLDTALSRLVDRANRIEAALESGDAGTGIVSPLATRWVRFGRETRFALDDHRDAVTETMPGHHRLKAGSDDAGTAVDFVEALDSDIESFPFGPATATFGPEPGDTVRIVHAKPTGEAFDLGRGTVTDRTPAKERITVEREMTSSGRYDALETAREPGDTATTRFAEGRWWYPTVYRGSAGDSKGTYVNVATPVEVFPERSDTSTSTWT
jgi:RNA-binding protein AU-1